MKRTCVEYKRVEVFSDKFYLQQLFATTSRISKITLLDIHASGLVQEIRLVWVRGET